MTATYCTSEDCRVCTACRGGRPERCAGSILCVHERSVRYCRTAIEQAEAATE